MKIALFLLVAVSLSLLLNTAHAETGVFTSDASKDGFASASSAGASGSFINIGNVEGKIRRGFLYFDTSVLPDAAEITSAKLTVHGYNFAKSKCKKTGNLDIALCSFDPLSKDDFSACNGQPQQNTGAFLNLPETGGRQRVSVNIDPKFINKADVTQLKLASQDETCKTGELENYARICADGGSSGCTADTKPILEVTYSVPVEILSADVSNVCPVEAENIDVRCQSSVPNVDCISARIGDTECVWNEPDSRWEGDVAVFKNCAAGAATQSACGTGSREVKCYVQTDKCQQTGANKTTAIDVQAAPVLCSERADQQACEADDLCSWAPLCSGAKKSRLSDQCVPKDSNPNYQCEANSCGAECDGSVGCPSKLVADTCKYSGVCDQQNTCACSYTDQYCPQPGTTKLETDSTTTCYYGIRTCEASGCSLLTCTLNAGETCNSSDGCIVPPPSTCGDSVKNNDETDVDCGGSCDKCADNKMCSVNNDCQSNNCVNGVCTTASAVCGNNICESGETAANCPADCTTNNPPVVSVSHLPENPSVTSLETSAAATVTLTATAADNNGISAVRIFADGAQVKQCSSSPCAHIASFFAGTHTYYAEADDDGVPIATGRDPASGTKSFTVSAQCTPQCSGKSCGDSDTCGGKCIVQSCSTGQTCNTNGQCAQCGGANQACCSSNACNSGLICRNGICTSPIVCDNDRICQYPETAANCPGDCGTNSPPVLSSVAAAISGSDVTVTSIATDSDSDLMTLRCGNIPGITNNLGCVSAGPAASNPSCAFKASWQFNGVYAIYCNVVDNRNGLSSVKNTTVTFSDGVSRGTSANFTLKEGESATIPSRTFSGLTLTVIKITIPAAQEAYGTCVIQNVEVRLTAASPALSENHNLFKYPVAPSSIRKFSTLIKFKSPGTDMAGNKFAIFEASDTCSNVPYIVCGSDSKAYLNACAAEAASILTFTEGACAGKCYAVNDPCRYSSRAVCLLSETVSEVSCSSAQCAIGPCTICGNAGQACCNDVCNVDAGLNCAPFGTSGEKRCSRAAPCGDENERCCRGGLGPSHLECNEDLVCHTGKCRKGTDIISCKRPQLNCGAVDQQCCLPDNTCNSGMVCDIGRCKPPGAGACGDGKCNIGENSVTCPQDCKPLTRQNRAGSATGGDFLSRLFELLFT